MKDNEDTHVNMNGDDETPEDEDRLILSEEDVKDLILREYNIVEKKFLELYNNPDMSFSEVIGSAHTIFSGLEEIDELLESGNLDSQQAKDLKNLTSERKESGFAEVYDILFEHLILDDLYIYHSALDSALGNLFPLNIINDSLPERKKDSFSQTYFDEPKLVEQIKDLDLGRMIDVYFVINDVLFKGPEQPCFGEFYKDLVLKNKDKKSYLPRASGEVSFEYLPAILDDDCLKEFF
ncbi:MAG TPA: hypothetical protein ENF94_01570, partial [Candidatus Woesearchaeota archaeon]|nr:hypothetical protein [Candidatus Woesearchaeota archaeon]